MLLRAVTYAIVVVLLLPLAVIVATSFTTLGYVSFPPQGFTLRWYGEALGKREFLDSFVLSLGVAAMTALLATLLGTPVAVALARHRFAGRALLVQALGDLESIDRLHPVELRRHRARLVALQRPDAVPFEGSARQHLGHRRDLLDTFLDVVFAERSLAGVVGLTTVTSLWLYTPLFFVTGSDSGSHGR